MKEKPPKVISIDKYLHNEEYPSHSNIMIAKKDDQYWLVSGDYLQGSMNIKDPDSLTLDYIRAMSRGWSQYNYHKKEPESALHLGLGAGCLLRFIESQWSTCEQTVIEIHPKLLKALKKFFPLPHFSFVLGDALHLNQLSLTKFDWILIDVFNNDGEVLDYNWEWWLSLEQLVQPNGLVTINMFPKSIVDWLHILKRSNMTNFALLDRVKINNENWITHWRLMAPFE